MATFNGTVGAGADNGYVDSNGSSFFSNTIMFFGKSGLDIFSIWARWTNVTIPQGSTINSVVVTLQSSANRAGDTCNANIYFDNEDNAASPTNYTDYTGKPITSAIAWNAIPHELSAIDYNTPDLTSILQTVINRSGWVSGNSLQFFIKDNGSDNGAIRTWKDFTTDNLNCARIAIDYTAPATTSSSSSSSSTSSTSSSTSSTSSSSSTSSTSSSSSSTSSSTSSTSSSSSTSSTSSSSSTSSTSSSTSSTSSSSSTSSTSTSSTSSSHSTSSTSSSSSISTSSTSSSSTSTTLPPATTSSSSSSTSTSTSTSTTTILFHPKIDILQSLLHGRPSGEFS